MNKDEFKQKILNQFRAKDAPIRALMYADHKTVRWNPTNYKERDAFVVKKFETAIFLDWITDGDEIVFQVQFRDVTPATQGYLLATHLEPHNKHIFKRPYYVEKVDFLGSVISFSLESFELLMDEEYNFQEKDKHPSFQILYDAVSRNFYQNTTSNTLNIWKYARANPGSTYVDYGFTDLAKKALLDFLKINKIEQQEADRLLSFFEISERTSGRSPMFQIAWHIHHNSPRLF